MTDYPLAGFFQKNGAIHCTTLAVTKNLTMESGLPRVAMPTADLRNGTLTFVKSDSRIYGITCDHVVDYYRDLVENSGEGIYSLRTMVNGFYVVIDRFIRPSVQWGDDRPDIAIREMSPAHLKSLGKEAMDLDQMREPPDDIRHACAVGFPEHLKRQVQHRDKVSYQVQMPQVQVLAELSGRPERRFTMFSELQTPAPDIDYSGMSGGPIYWSTTDEFGILGIVYEGGAGADNNSIYVYGDLATPQLIKGWIDQYRSALKE